MSKHGLDFKKLDARIDWCEMDKFLLIPGIECPFVCDDAENYLSVIKDAYWPADHGKKTDKELLNELKSQFIHRAEKMGMSLQEFHDSLSHDEKSRYIIYDHK